MLIAADKMTTVCHFPVLILCIFLSPIFDSNVCRYANTGSPLNTLFTQCAGESPGGRVGSCQGAAGPARGSTGKAGPVWSWHCTCPQVPACHTLDDIAAITVLTVTVILHLRSTDSARARHMLMHQQGSGVISLLKLADLNHCMR